MAVKIEPIDYMHMMQKALDRAKCFHPWDDTPHQIRQVIQYAEAYLKEYGGDEIDCSNGIMARLDGLEETVDKILNNGVNARNMFE